MKRIGWHDNVGRGRIVFGPRRCSDMQVVLTVQQTRGQYFVKKNIGWRRRCSHPMWDGFPCGVLNGSITTSWSTHYISASRYVIHNVSPNAMIYNSSKRPKMKTFTPDSAMSPHATRIIVMLVLRLYYFLFFLSFLLSPPFEPGKILRQNRATRKLRLWT